MRSLLLLACALAGLSSADGRDDAAKLAGEWEGSTDMVSTGACGIVLGGHDVRLMVTVDADGVLRGRLDPAPTDLPPEASFWRGRLTGDLVEFVEPERAICNGQPPRAYTIKQTGALEKGAGLTMRLSGDDAPCPDLGCTFRRTYVLTWKRPLPQP